MSTSRKDKISTSILDQLLFEEEQARRALLSDCVPEPVDTTKLKPFERFTSFKEMYPSRNDKPLPPIQDETELFTEEEIDNEIEKIERELIVNFGKYTDEKILDEDYLDDSETVFSPRYYYLNVKHKALIERRNALKRSRDNFKKISAKNTIVSPPPSLSVIDSIRNYIKRNKKSLDGVEDGLNIAKNGTSSLSPGLANVMDKGIPVVGGLISTVICAYETDESKTKLMKAIDDEKKRLRDVKVATHLVATGNFAAGALLSGTSVILTITVLILTKLAMSAALATVTSAALYIPTIAAACMTIGYAARLVKNSFSLHDYKKKIEYPRKAYKKLKQGTSAEIHEINHQIRMEHHAKNHHRSQINVLLEKKLNHTELSKADNEKLTELNRELKNCTLEQHTLHTRIMETRADFFNNDITKKYNALKQKTRGAERKVAFGAIETVGYSLITISTGFSMYAASLIPMILAGSAAAAASAAASGGIALGLIIVGVAIGIAVDRFQEYDKEHNYKYSNAMRKFFTTSWKKTKQWFSGKENKTNQLAEDLSPTVSEQFQSSTASNIKIFKNNNKGAKQERPQLVISDPQKPQNNQSTILQKPKPRTITLTLPDTEETNMKYSSKHRTII